MIANTIEFIKVKGAEGGNGDDERLFEKGDDEHKRGLI